MLTSFLKTLGLLFLLIAGGLYFDSIFFKEITDYGQTIADAILIGIFFLIFFRVSARYKEQMIYAVVIGYVGEYLFSIIFGMYSYQLGNIPHYVPFGHAIVYIANVYFIKQKAIQLNRQLLEKCFLVVIVLYSLFFLFFYNDCYGFILTLLSIYFLRNKPRERLFYYSMYLVVVYLELIGTYYQSWYWPSIAFDIYDFLPSANPPSGISFFYFGLDLGCLWLYKKRHQIAWKRMKNIRLYRSTEM